MGNWKVGEGYEQAIPGIYIYDTDTGAVVWSEDTPMTQEIADFLIHQRCEAEELNKELDNVIVQLEELYKEAVEKQNEYEDKGDEGAAWFSSGKRWGYAAAIGLLRYGITRKR